MAVFCLMAIAIPLSIGLSARYIKKLGMELGKMELGKKALGRMAMAR